jgi:two-component system chemotaxis response regulator CheY
VDSKRLTALVVDDDPDVRAMIALMLEDLGFRVLQAGDGRHAIETLEATRPELLCLDLMLPEKSGYDVCEHVATSAALRGLPILMMSARDMPEDRAIAEELGVRTYLTKPFTHTAFVDGVRATLDGQERVT